MTRILFFGLGKEPSIFIQRRINALSKNNIQCLFLSESIPRSKSRIKKIFYFSIGLIKVFFLNRKFFATLKIFFCLIRVPFVSRCRITYKYHTIFNSNPQVIHFQWITHLSEMSWVTTVFNAPIIASVRGSMLTVYPFKYDNYEEKLSKAFFLADRLHFVSKGLMNYCLHRFQLDPAKCFLNYNGIDTEKFKPLENELDEISDDKVRIISVGALIWRKNFQDLLKIVSQSKFLDKIEILIIGEGEERFILNFLINKYQLNSHVKLLGQMQEIEIMQYLQHADIYISTSYSEGLSNAVMEAASCGLPVIAFDCEGMDEIIRPDLSGIIIPHGRNDLFVQRLDQLIENKKLRQEMGRLARQHVVENFDESKHVEDMISEYKRLINQFNVRNTTTD